VNDPPQWRILTGRQAAARVGVSPVTVRWWHHTGRLSPIALCGRALLYHELDVLHAESDTRRRGRRRVKDKAVG
jgi:predicted site-specific integrase-resolvase